MKKNKVIKTATIIMSLFSLLGLGACEKTSSEPEVSFFDVQGENGFMGTVSGTNAFIALLVAREEAIVYVCNGDEEIHEWFRGDNMDPTKISLTNGAGVKVVAEFTGTTFEGDVTFTTDDKEYIHRAPQ